MVLVLSNKGKGMQPLVGEERYMTTLITAANNKAKLHLIDEI